MRKSKGKAPPTNRPKKTKKKITRVQSLAKKSTIPESLRDLWCTPDHRNGWDFVREVLGDDFTDLCASSDPANHRAKRNVTREADAFSLPWGDLNYANFPYSDSERWVSEFLRRSSGGNPEEVQTPDLACLEVAKHPIILALLPARVEAEWFGNLRGAAAVWFPKGRISFTHPNDRTWKGSPRFASAFALWDWQCRRVERFRQAAALRGGLLVRPIGPSNPTATAFA